MIDEELEVLRRNVRRRFWLAIVTCLALIFLTSAAIRHAGGLQCLLIPMWNTASKLPECR